MTMMQANTPPDLTPKLVRAARALLAWSQQDLAEAANVATSTVADFERGKRTPVANNAQAIRGALESAGICFLPTGVVIGADVPGTTLPKPMPPKRSGIPNRWVNADDLSNWANQADSAFKLPSLISDLIYAVHGSGAKLRFPADGSVWHSGWDGYTSVVVGSGYVPQGESGWELSTQRRDIAQKATDDYRKRTEHPTPLEPDKAAFVFVTPCRWDRKDEWVKDRKNEGIWREVRAYDADDLVHWIGQAPAVELRLATCLGKRPSGIRELEDIWKEWSHATQRPLTEELVLSDRDEDANEVLRWLRGEPSILALQATTTNEVAAFFYAALNSMPDDEAVTYRTRCIVATTAESARMLAKALTPSILLLTEPESGLAHTLVGDGHHVLLAYDDRPVSGSMIRVLARPSRDGIVRALIKAGIPDHQAHRHARDSGRNLVVLCRLISGLSNSPRWAQEKLPHALLAALLAGGWEEDVEEDKALLGKIAGQAYKDFIHALTPYIGLTPYIDNNLDKPLRIIGRSRPTWRVASPLDAWRWLAPHLTSFDIECFEDAAHSVLGSADTSCPEKGTEEELWRAAMQGARRVHSETLRHGIGRTLILLALHGDKVRAVPDAARQADAIVSKLLLNADQQRRWLILRDFRSLAEASPDAFLAAIEGSLNQSDPPISVLLGAVGGRFGCLSDLLEALELLALWPERMLRVTSILARLDEIDDSPGRHMSRPADSLRRIHFLRKPQTRATLDQRLQALDQIRGQKSDTAWKLMLGILPNERVSTRLPTPRWRNIPDKVEDVTRELVSRSAEKITEKLLEDVGVDAMRWSQLLERFTDLAPSPEVGLAALEEAEQKITDKDDRAKLWKNLRCVLHHHRQVPDAEWAMPEEVLDRLEAVYDRLTPLDPLERIAWLFEEDSAAIPKPSTPGWETEQRDVETARREAVQTLFTEGGMRAILGLARQVGAAAYIGKALYDNGIKESDLDALLEAALQSDNDKERSVAHGLIISAFQDRREPWAEALIAKAKDEAWGDTALLTILRALPVQQRWTWDQVAKAGPKIEDIYWSQAPVFWMSEDSADVVFAIRKLISVDRARHALPLAKRGSKIHLPSDVLVEVLQEAVRQPFENNGGTNAITMFRYYVAEILQVLDERSDVDKDTLIKLEWAYLSILEHSRRPPKVLLRALSEQPELFVQMLCAAYRASEESGVVEVGQENPEYASDVACQAHCLLQRWDYLPGTRDDGTIDGQILEAWIKEARSLAKAEGREDVADIQIGNMLSASPVGTDGNWPAEAVRDVIDLFCSEPMTRNFRIGKSNRRGVTCRMPRDGGNLERQEAAKYRSWAEAIAYEHPRTARALNTLADSYESQARQQDERAERWDWE